MPIFELICFNCQTKKEVICKFDDIINNAICTNCGNEMRLKPSRAGFHINGHSFSNGYNDPGPEKDYTYQGTSQEWNP